MFENITIHSIDTRQWLLGVRNAAISVHDEIYQSLKPILNGKAPGISERTLFLDIEHDIVQQKSASIFVLRSASGIRNKNEHRDNSGLPDCENLGELQQGVDQYLESIRFLRDISYRLLPLEEPADELSTQQVAESFEGSRRALRGLLLSIDRSLGIHHMDYRMDPGLKTDLTPPKHNLGN